jgi:hypothetical protein
MGMLSKSSDTAVKILDIASPPSLKYFYVNQKDFIDRPTGIYPDFDRC